MDGLFNLMPETMQGEVAQQEECVLHSFFEAGILCIQTNDPSERRGAGGWHVFHVHAFYKHVNSNQDITPKNLGRGETRMIF